MGPESTKKPGKSVRVETAPTPRHIEAPPAPAGHDTHSGGFGERFLSPLDGLTQHELLLAFMDSTPDWLFAKDLEYRFLFVNESFAAAKGLTPRDMVGRKDSEFWGEVQSESDAAVRQQKYRNDDDRASAGETVHNPRDESTLADGSVCVFDTVKSPLRGPDGRIVGVVGRCRNVTERHRAYEALHASEERFRTVVGNIPGSVYRSETGPPYKEIFLSEGIASITGFEAREYFEPGGPSCGDLVLPEDRARVANAVNAAIEERKSFQARYRIRHRDGSIRWVSEQGRATYGPDGTPLYLDGVHIDVTAQVEAEEALREREQRLRAIVENEPECVKVMDREGLLLEMNPAGLRMIEAKSLDQVRGKPVNDFIIDADRPAFAEMTEAVFRGESRTLVFGLTGLSGTRRTLETHSVPIWDTEKRAVRALLGVTRDITERLRAEEARLALESQLLQSQKMEAMGTLAGGIAHDFNNILTAIIGNAELLALDLPEEGRLRANVTTILSASARARDLVRQILTFSSSHSEDRYAIELQPIMQDVLRLMQATLPPAIEIRAEISPACRKVTASASQMQQVLMNLCTNAAHAMREHGGILTVSVDDVELDEAFCSQYAMLTPGPYVTFSVSDTGHGLAPAELGRIFEPFYTTKSASEGTGLGLAVVHGIVQSHMGQVTVESQLGCGTSFRAYLPESDGAAEIEEARESTIPIGSGEHILVVDDESAVVDAVTEMLGELGYRTTGYDSPVDALAGLRREPGRFDLILCDLKMPEMSGLEFAARAHEIRSDLDVVLTSGFGGDVDSEQLALAGIHELLSKPFDFRELAEMAKRYL